MSSLIPEEELRRQGSLNLAPMVDFLFLILAVFAVLAVTRAALFDHEVHLVKVHPSDKGSALPAYNDFYTVNIAVTEEGKYRWITEVNEFLMDGVVAIQQEIGRQEELGLLPKEKEKTRVLLHIDKGAKWDPISKVIFAIRESGYQIHPVYEPAK